MAAIPLLRRAPSDGLAGAYPELTRENATELLNTYANPLDDANRRILSEAGVALLRRATASVRGGDAVDIMRREFEIRSSKSEEDCHKICVLLVFDPDQSGGLSRPRGRDDRRLELGYDSADPEGNLEQLKRFPSVILTAQWSEAGFSGIWGGRMKSAGRAGVGGVSKYCETLCECARRELTEETGIPPVRALELLPDGTRPTRYEDGGAVFVVRVPTYDALWKLTAYVPVDRLETRAVGCFPICFEMEGSKCRHWPHYMANGALRGRAGRTTRGIMKSLLYAKVISAEEVGLLFDLAADEHARERTRFFLPTKDNLKRTKEHVLGGAGGQAVADHPSLPARPPRSSLADRLQRSEEDDGGAAASGRSQAASRRRGGGASGGGRWRRRF